MYNVKKAARCRQRMFSQLFIVFRYVDKYWDDENAKARNSNVFIIVYKRAEEFIFLINKNETLFP